MGPRLLNDQDERQTDTRCTRRYLHTRFMTHCHSQSTVLHSAQTSIGWCTNGGSQGFNLNSTRGPSNPLQRDGLAGLDLLRRELQLLHWREVGGLTKP